MTPSIHDDAPTENDERPEPINFTLVILSPSVGIDRPLTFSHLPATTSIKELKAKIRDALATKPADENQRLIHRGRLLARETETMTEVFGRETVRKLPPSDEIDADCYSWRAQNLKPSILSYVRLERNPQHLSFLRSV